MREIKFRAWLSWYSDEKEKTVGKMLDAEEKVLKRDVGFIIHDDMIQHLHMKSQAKLEWLQFTGLKDKNGKEIYEGDILKINPDDDDWNDFVVWWDKGARFELKSFVKNPNSRTEIIFAEMTEGYENPAIIIGNIYENLELLKVTQ